MDELISTPLAGPDLEDLKELLKERVVLVGLQAIQNEYTGLLCGRLVGFTEIFDR